MSQCSILRGHFYVKEHKKDMQNIPFFSNCKSRETAEPLEPEATATNKNPPCTFILAILSRKHVLKTVHGRPSVLGHLSRPSRPHSPSSVKKKISFLSIGTKPSCILPSSCPGMLHQGPCSRMRPWCSGRRHGWGKEGMEKEHGKRVSRKCPGAAREKGHKWWLGATGLIFPSLRLGCREDTLFPRASGKGASLFSWNSGIPSLAGGLSATATSASEVVGFR